ncbi:MULTISPECIES: hypothetical protein [Sphingobacterium]|uniref:hypothetical protein n=1 Tax=Sphingobacterium TaxID=28453 RepID=UPI0028B20B02|nr:hypothetical protein [Sphingobacterium multivorum]
MEKVAFTPEGFKQLEAQLYDLSDSELLDEANAILADYITWADEHIILNTAQISYLNSLDNLFIASLASKAAIAFVNRLPINLVLPDDYDDEEEGRGKWFFDNSTISANNTSGEPVVATGELIYTFVIPE